MTIRIHSTVLRWEFAAAILFLVPTDCVTTSLHGQLIEEEHVEVLVSAGFLTHFLSLT